jgi:hypothetical protein
LVDKGFDISLSAATDIVISRLLQKVGTGGGVQFVRAYHTNFDFVRDASTQSADETHDTGKARK